MYNNIVEDVRATHKDYILQLKILTRMIQSLPSTFSEPLIQQIITIQKASSERDEKLSNMLKARNEDIALILSDLKFNLWATTKERDELQRKFNP